MWLNEEWSMKTCAGLDMVEVYSQICKFSHIGDYRDMFLWRETLRRRTLEFTHILQYTWCFLNQATLHFRFHTHFYEILLLAHLGRYDHRSAQWGLLLHVQMVQ